MREKWIELRTSKEYTNYLTIKSRLFFGYIFQLALYILGCYSVIEELSYISHILNILASDTDTNGTWAFNI